MPEGDTIFRTAVRLRSVLLEKKIVEAASREPNIDAEKISSSTVERVEARGKHLLIGFDNRLVLHSHMGMTGSWHVYAPGEPWRKPERRAAVVLQCEDVIAVCYSPKLIELLTADALRRHRYLQRLGPDLLGGEINTDEIIRRFRVHDPTPIGQAVLNQTIVCGIGNVYKSETLFLTGIDPFAAVATLDDTQIVSLVQKARELMLANLEGYPRTTRRSLDGRRAWVYGRAGEPCFQCGTVIQMQRQGDLGRSTYWCPKCQKAGGD